MKRTLHGMNDPAMTNVSEVKKAAEGKRTAVRTSGNVTAMTKATIVAN